VLDQHDKAWTADAGGQQNGAASDSPSDAQQQQPADAAAALAALLAASVPVAPPAAAATATASSEAAAVEAGLPGAATPVVTGAAVAVAATSADVASAAATDALPDAVAGAPADGEPPAASTSTIVAATTPDAAPSADAEAGTTGQGQSQGDTPKGGAHTARHAVDGARSALAGLTPANAQDAASATAAAPPAPAPAPAASASSAAPTLAEAIDAAPAAPATEAPTPNVAVNGAAATATPRAVTAPNPVPVAHAPAALADLVQVAHERGVGQARMVLHPDSLGGVEVHLRQTAEGIRATVHVQHSEALQVLQSGLGDLRRGLEERGVTVDQIDLGLAPGNQGEQQGNGAARGDGGLGARTSVTGLSALGAADDDTLTTPNATSTRAPAGVLVDVMA